MSAMWKPTGWKAIIVIALSVAACGGGDSEAPSGRLVAMYKDLGFRQCEPSSGMPLSALVLQLTAVGVPAQPKICAFDGLVHLSVCGASIGGIGVVDVPEELVGAAAAQGFRAYSELPAPLPLACPGQF